MNLLKYLLHRATWEKLPTLPRSYAGEYTAADVDRDTATIMQLTRVRCPSSVDALQARYRAHTRGELLRKLRPNKRRRHPVKRLMATIRRACGLLPYDPMKQYASHKKRF